jgi:hypothetical protein
MTKKDYITIANALKPFYQDYKLDRAWVDIQSSEGVATAMIQAISKALSQDNPKFNAVKFLDYLRK